MPLAGHTHGHCGVAVKVDERWLLHAGDACFHRGEVAPRPHCTPGLRFYQDMMEVNREARLANQARVRDLALSRAADIRVFCSHDPVEFERMAAAEEDAGALATAS